MKKVKAEYFFMSLQEAVNYYESLKNKSKRGNKFEKYIKQTNK